MFFYKVCILVIFYILYVNFYKICETLVKSIFSSICIEQEVLVSGEFTVTLTDKYVNNQNEKAVKGVININPELEEDLANINIYPVDKDGKIIGKKMLASDITIKHSTSKVDIVMDTTLNNYNMPEGIVSFKLIAGSYKTGKVLAEFTAEKHTEEIDLTKIMGLKATRPSNESATISFVVDSDVQIIKAYYIVKNHGDAAAVYATDFVKDGKLIAPYVQVKNNKVENASIPVNDATRAYDVYFVLEDQYGSISTAVCNGSSTEVYALVPRANYTDTAKTVTKVQLPKLEEETSTASAKAVINVDKALESDDKFVAILYKDGKPIAQSEISVSATEVDGKKVEVALSKFVPSIEGAGEYQLAVFGEGSNMVAPSETTYSNTETVAPIASVKTPEFSTYLSTQDNRNHSKLAWETSYHDQDIGGYEVKVSEYNQSAKNYQDFDELGTISGTITNSENSKTKEVVDSSSIQDNTLYKAQVVVKVKTGHKLSEADSKPSVSKEFFKLETPQVVSNLSTASESTLELVSAKTTPVTISGKTPTYKVEVYTINTSGEAGKGENKYQRASQFDQEVEVNKSSGRFTVKGLNPGTRYAIRLVATVDGVDGKVEGKSEYVEIESTKKLMSSIDHDIVADGEDTRNGKISVNSDHTIVSIDGDNYNVSEYEGLAKVVDLIAALKENDHVKYSVSTPNEVTIKISTTDNTAQVRTLPASVKGMKVYITGNPYSQEIATTSGNKPAEVNITGVTGGTLTIENVNADKIVLNGGKYNTGTARKLVTVASGSTVTFKDSEFTASVSKETPMRVEAHRAAIVTTSNNATNDIKFSAVTGGLNVVFGGDGTTETSQAGSLEVSGEGDMVVLVNSPSNNSTLTQVTSSLKVTTKNGEVDLSNNRLKGAQSVTVAHGKTAPISSNNTVKAYTALTSTFALTNLPVKYYDYDNQDDYNALKVAIPSIVVKTDEGTDGSRPTKVDDIEATKANFKAVNDYLEALNLIKTDNNGGTYANGGAQVSVAKGSNLVTITFTAKTRDSNNNPGAQVVIGGLRK